MHVVRFDFSQVFVFARARTCAYVYVYIYMYNECQGGSPKTERPKFVERPKSRESGFRARIREAGAARQARTTPRLAKAWRAWRGSGLDGESLGHPPHSERHRPSQQPLRGCHGAGSGGKGFLGGGAVAWVAKAWPSRARIREAGAARPSGQLLGWRPGGPLAAVCWARSGLTRNRRAGQQGRGTDDPGPVAQVTFDEKGTDG